MATIHPTAVIDPKAEIAADVEIGPFCVIGPSVAIGSRCRLTAHVHLSGHTIIGAGTRIAPFASLGTPPQSTKYRGGPTRLIVGADCDIREAVTMNTGTEDGGGITQVGDRCFLMAGSHVGHDCRVGNDVTIANNTVLGGHVILGDHVVLGGQSAIHQFVRIGEGAMVAGVSGAPTDLIPFGFAIGSHANLDGLNYVGMKRRGFSRATIHQLRLAYQQLFLGNGTFSDRMEAVEREFGGDPQVRKVLEFIRAGRTRPLMQAIRGTRSSRLGPADTP
jgi:UDP-N-acetylglucosamine acyltransferase